MNTIKINKKYWKYLFWVGLMLIVMGVSAWFVSNKWLPVPLALVIAGIVAIGIWLLTLDSADLTSASQTFWGRRSTQTGTNALAATVSAIAILAIINFLGVRYSARFDLTENQLFSLSPQSQKVVQNLTQPAKVWVFDRTPHPEDQLLLDNYRREGSNFSYEYVDPNANPGLASRFNAKEGGEVYLELGQKQKFVQKIDREQQLSEETITSSIQQIQSDRNSVVYFLQGHGEHPLESLQGGLSDATKYLEQKNFTSKSLNLAERSSIPQDASVVVIAGPKRALLEQEVNVLRDYLKLGGSVLLMLDPNTDAGLDKLLNDWGVKLENRLAVDASDDGRLLGLGPATPIVTDYGDHPITKDFGNGISFYQLARPIAIESVKDVTITPLLLTSQDSWGESDIQNKELNFDSKTDIRGPLTLGVALSKKNESKPEVQPTPASPPAVNSSQNPKESRLIVVGNSTFATDGSFGQQLNGDIFLNSISWLSQQDNQTLSIRPKQSNKRRLNLTLAQASLLAWISMLILPLIGFGTAGWLWWRRR